MSYALVVEKKHQAIYEAFKTALHDGGVGTMPDADVLPVVQAARVSLARESEQLFWTKNTAQLVFASSKSLDLSTVTMASELLTLPSAFCWFDEPVENVPFADNTETPLVAVSWHTIDARSAEGEGEEFQALVIVAYGRSKFNAQRFYAAQVDQTIFGNAMRSLGVGGTEVCHCSKRVHTSASACQRAEAR
jgi:hypothetical protein